MLFKKHQQICFFQAALIPPTVPPASSDPIFVLRAFEVSLEDVFCMRRSMANQVQSVGGIHSITKLKSSKEVNASAQNKKPWMREIMRCSFLFPGYADTSCIDVLCSHVCREEAMSGPMAMFEADGG